MYRRNYYIKTLSLLVWGLLLGAQIYTADAQTAQQIAKKAFESTVLLVMQDANGQSVSLGSGFFAAQGKIASNLHVVEGASRGYAKVVGQKDKYDIEGIIGINPDRDLVLLKVSAAFIPPLSLGNSDAVEVGEPVYAVGNPQGLEGTFSQGVVSGIRQVGLDKLLQITAPISPGSSGGPVLNSKGEVIGVSVATFKSGQNLNFAIPSNYLKGLLGSTGTVKPLVGVKSLPGKHSILGDIGQKGPDIIPNQGWGEVRLGASRKTVEKALGKCSETEEMRDALRGSLFSLTFFRYPEKGVVVLLERGFLQEQDKDKVKEIFFYNKDLSYETFSTFQGKTSKGISWDSTESEVIEVYGTPREEYSGIDRGKSWRRMVFYGIDFRFINHRMVRIGIPGQTY